MGPEATIDRASAADLVMVSTQSRGTAPEQLGVILRLKAGGALHVGQVRELPAQRIRAAPRLRQRLVPLPLGCGRPIWVDDGNFDISRHVTEAVSPPPGTTKRFSTWPRLW